MNSKHLKKTLQLIRRTGDKGIIIDEESGELFVIMDVDAYEKMLPAVSTSPVELTHDFDPKELLDDFAFDDPTSIAEQPEVRVEPIIPFHKPAPIQSNVLHEESLADVPNDGVEEEKFYLEPVE